MTRPMPLSPPVRCRILATASHRPISVYPGVYQEALRVPIHWYTRCEVLDGQIERRDDPGMDQIG